MDIWVWIGVAVGGVGLLAATRYLTNRVRARRKRDEQPCNSADDALSQGVINSLLDLFLP